MQASLNWRNRFAQLGEAFFTRLQPTALTQPYAIATSLRLARELGFTDEFLTSQLALEAFSGNATLVGSEPLASVYSGHQFGHWAGQLGDGRAILLGGIVCPDGSVQELQLKGAGLTPYSRMGDGRAVLRSSIREFLCSEALHALHIPTTRALYLSGSDDEVFRESIETAAVVTRVAPSFIRFGHFEHFSVSGHHAQLKILADEVIDQFYPECRATARFAQNPYAALLEKVSERTAATVAQWQSVGFCHGVMNTDNMSILGLTIDYGPFQFLDSYQPGHICNHSDTQGRYAYNQQPHIAYWNLFCLGQALLPLIGEPELAMAALESYKTVFPRELEQRFNAKLGFKASHPGVKTLTENILKLLAQDQVDFTIFWRCLTHVACGTAPPETVQDLFIDRTQFNTWMLSYSELQTEYGIGFEANLMLKTNPAYVLRNHLGEQAIRQAQQKDFSEIHRLLALLENPFNEQPGMAAYAALPPDWAASLAISCSS